MNKEEKKIYKQLLNKESSTWGDGGNISYAGFYEFKRTHPFQDTLKEVQIEKDQKLKQTLIKKINKVNKKIGRDIIQVEVSGIYKLISFKRCCKKFYIVTDYEGTSKEITSLYYIEIKIKNKRFRKQFFSTKLNKNFINNILYFLTEYYYRSTIRKALEEQIKYKTMEGCINTYLKEKGVNIKFEDDFSSLRHFSRSNFWIQIVYFSDKDCRISFNGLKCDNKHDKEIDAVIQLYKEGMLVKCNREHTKRYKELEKKLKEIENIVNK